MTDSTKQPMTSDMFLLEVISNIRQALGDTDKLMLNELAAEIIKRKNDQSAIVAELEAKLEWWRELFPSITPSAAVEYQTVYDKACKAEKLNDELIKQLDRVVGDHDAPRDCYATGPLTGDTIMDLVSCPSCEAIVLLAKLRG